MRRLILRTYVGVLLAAVIAAVGSAVLVQNTTDAHERAMFKQQLNRSRVPMVGRIESADDPHEVLTEAARILGPNLAIIPNDVLPLDTAQRRSLRDGEAIRYSGNGPEFIYIDIPRLDAALEVELGGPDATVLQSSYYALLMQRGSDTAQLSPSLRANLDELTKLERARVAWRPVIQRTGPLNLHQRVVFTPPVVPFVVATPYILDLKRTRRMLLFAIGLLFVIVGIALALRPIGRELTALGRAAEAVRTGDLGARARPHTSSGAVTEVAQQFDAMAERIQDLLGEQEELFRSVNHELRTPIARMLFNLDLMEEASELERSSLLAILKTTTTEMQELTDELLTFARLADGAPPLDSMEIDLGELIEDIVARWPGIHHEGSTSEVLIQGDSRLLFRALDNLASNAVRYAAGGRIGVERDSDWVHVFIDDDGPGIPAANRERIFQPFVRGDGSRSRETGGTGIGLAIVHRIALRHGGRVTVQDGAVSGSRFRLSLPRTSTS